jgi:hypothetical protein
LSRTRFVLLAKRGLADPAELDALHSTLTGGAGTAVSARKRDVRHRHAP